MNRWSRWLRPLPSSASGSSRNSLRNSQRIHGGLSGGVETVGLVPAPRWNAGRFAEALQEARDDDRRLRRSTVGIHKDDVDFRIGDHPLKRFGSQGQQKTFLLALRLAQVEHLARRVGRRPILLLDDIFDKIDAHRASALMEALGQARLWSGVHFRHGQCPDSRFVLAKAGVDHASWWVSEDGGCPLGETVQSEPEP